MIIKWQVAALSGVDQIPMPSYLWSSTAWDAVAALLLIRELSCCFLITVKKHLRSISLVVQLHPNSRYVTSLSLITSLILNLIINLVTSICVVPNDLRGWKLTDLEFVSFQFSKNIICKVQIEDHKYALSKGVFNDMSYLNMAIDFTEHFPHFILVWSRFRFPTKLNLKAYILILWAGGNITSHNHQTSTFRTVFFFFFRNLIPWQVIPAQMNRGKHASLQCRTFISRSDQYGAVGLGWIDERAWVWYGDAVITLVNNLKWLCFIIFSCKAQPWLKSLQEMSLLIGCFESFLWHVKIELYWFRPDTDWEVS